jgi:LPXTG-site transpeptidase (sortase) family protein
MGLKIMKMKNKFKIILMIVLGGGIIFAGGYFLLQFRSNQIKTSTLFNDSSFGWKFPVARLPLTASLGQLAYSNIRATESVPQGLPVRLQIPVIGVDSAIEDALITPDGKMDVPAGSADVAWFALGPRPGQVGSAVIGGHFGVQNNVPSVFYNLDKLQIGDKVYVVDDENNTLAFQVWSISLFDRNADATTVFTSNDGLAHLNLITCEGVWNQIDGNYPERRVVFTEAIPGEGAVTVNKIPALPALPVFSRSLRLGAQGADVTALQNILQQKGFLAPSSKNADGFFGTATRAALAKYQASLGLSADGVLGPLTREKFVSEQSRLAISPALPSTAIINTPSFSWPQTFIQSVKNLYAAPINGIIASILLLAIVFVISRIVLLL